MNGFIVATIISIIYFIVKFAEMKAFEKEYKPIKYLVRDCILVYFSVFIGNYVISQMTPIIQNQDATEVFTDNPSF